MLYIKLRGSQSTGSGEDFEGFLPYMAGKIILFM